MSTGLPAGQGFLPCDRIEARPSGSPFLAIFPKPPYRFPVHTVAEGIATFDTKSPLLPRRSQVGVSAACRKLKPRNEFERVLILPHVGDHRATSAYRERSECLRRYSESVKMPRRSSPFVDSNACTSSPGWSPCRRTHPPQKSCIGGRRIAAFAAFAPLHLRCLPR